MDEWTFTIGGQVDEPVSWRCEEFLAFPSESPIVDIHCVTKWTKLYTTWWVAYEFGGEPLESEHGRPPRLLVPHLCFWKSAKWVRGLTLTPDDEPGFWEIYGYHNHSDPWLEQRYQGD